MMFLLRSAFWLSLVFSWMPLERTEIARGLNKAQTMASHEEAAAKIGCGGSAVACGAVLLAAAKVGVDAPARASLDNRQVENAKLSNMKPKAPASAGARSSASSLTEADLAPRWRGHKAKPGA
jgi:hypothetical protein